MINKNILQKKTIQATPTSLKVIRLIKSYTELNDTKGMRDTVKGNLNLLNSSTTSSWRVQLAKANFAMLAFNC